MARRKVSGHRRILTPPPYPPAQRTFRQTLVESTTIRQGLAESWSIGQAYSAPS